MIGVISAAALLLAAAGLAKLWQRTPLRSALAAAGVPGARRLAPRLANRLSGAVELTVAAAALLFGGRFGAALLTAAYVVLAVLSARMMKISSGQDCGCFAKPVPVSHWHTAVNLSCAAAGLIAVVQPAGSLPARIADQPVTGSALLLAAGALAYLAYLMMTALPELTAAVAELEAAS